MDNYSAAAAVRAGSTALTMQFGPGWAWKVNTATLNITSLRYCVASQVWRAYHSQGRGYQRLICVLAGRRYRWFIPIRLLFSPEIRRAATHYGFLAGPSLGAAATLENEWIREIARLRLEKARLSPELAMAMGTATA